MYGNEFDLFAKNTQISSTELFENKRWLLFCRKQILIRPKQHGLLSSIPNIYPWYQKPKIKKVILWNET
jgi:hypothetical protein